MTSDESELDHAATRAVLTTLGTAVRGALPVPQLIAAVRGRGVDRRTCECCLSQLERADRVVVREHTAFDPHLDAVDLRTAALVEGGAGGMDAAYRAADACWDDLVRAFLATHRC